ncbi:peptidoglycan-binding domain-containing protein [Streptomyces sp. NPDC048484]|uniref:peptidoglycan-binding domain-containing protein n=1 Tax=Streptomyces sp. NPDC048484 TaxID=3155146 RepID=UPI003445C081
MSRLSSRKQLGALVGAVFLVGAGGWFAGTQVHSPADAAAAHQAPKAGPVTVKVQRQALTATVVSTGSVEFASPRPLSLAGSVGTGTAAAAAAAGEGAEQRVTKPPVAGTKVKEGDVLMTVNGRPVLALSGPVPMYRPLGPGATGDDVKQLQKALRRLGFDPGAVSGTFGQGTAASVTNWYQSKGHQAQQPSPDDQQQLGELQQSVSSAQQALLTVNDDTATGSESGAGTGTGAKDTETGAETGTETGTQSSSATAGGESSTDKEVRRLQRESAQKSLNMANAALSTFQASYGTKVPAGEVVFFPELPVRLDKVSVKAGDAASGQIGTVTSSGLTVQAVVPGTDARLLKKGMAAELTTNDGKKVAGTVNAIGADAVPPTTSGGGEGSEGSEGETSEGTGTGTGDTAATDTSGAAAGGGTSAPVQMRISIPEPGPLAGEARASVKVTIKIGASDGKVLTVPLAAVHTASDGQARVQVQRAGGVSDVHVTVGLSAAGVVEVEPDGGKLKRGDQVVVGE